MMESDSEFLRRHREQFSAREARIRATFPIGMMITEPEPQPPPPQENRLAALVNRKPIELTEEQQRSRRKALAMIEIERALAAEGAAAEAARAQVISDIKTNTAIGRLLR